ncbi:uncharacterized protein TNCV_3997461 [Trichonephila clavipes]|nr:uncharacterized protein TNCV_3997461 [Trichonephila clavipes]
MTEVNQDEPQFALSVNAESFVPKVDKTQIVATACFKNKCLLSTALILVKDKYSEWQTFRALLDSGRFPLIRWLPQEFQSTVQQIYRWKQEDFRVVKIEAELILEANRLKWMKQDLEKAENAYLSSFTSKKSKTFSWATAAAHGDPNGKNDYQKKGGKECRGSRTDGFLIKVKVCFDSSYTKRDVLSTNKPRSLIRWTDGTSNFQSKDFPPAFRFVEKLKRINKKWLVHSQQKEFEKAETFLGKKVQEQEFPSDINHLKTVHIELVSDLTSQAFIAALKRFMARRGKCAKLFSGQW